MEILIAVVLGFILDLIFGDPHFLPHPICFIGNLISGTEKLLRKILPKTKRAEISGGIILNFFVVSVSFIVPYFILHFAAYGGLVLKTAVETFFCYQIFAAKSLKCESMKVYYPLIKNDLTGARKYLSYIVGRDTENLTAEGVTKATVETIAENTSDGVIAPLIFMMIGGAPLGFLYKAVNTLDSMVGYKNDKYINFGKFSAKADDFFNFIPAIVSAYLMLVSAVFLKLDFKNGWRIYKRDRFNHASPNSAKTESVCAGVLRVALAGDAYYFGTLYKKPYIGDAIRPISPDDIILTNRIMYTSAVLGIVIFGILRLIGAVIL